MIAIFVFSIALLLLWGLNGILAARRRVHEFEELQELKRSAEAEEARRDA